MNPSEPIAQFLGVLLAAIIAGFVAADARRRGLPLASALGWGLGVFCALIVFLPLYLWQRKRDLEAPNQGQVASGSSSSAACPYCQYPNSKSADYCGKCGRQMRSSTEIHR